MQNESVLCLTRRFSALVVVALSLPLASAFAAVTIPEDRVITPPVELAPASPGFINTLLPIAPTNGLDQRLMPSLNTPASESLITITPGPAVLGIAPGGASGCTMGREGLAASLAQGACAGVVNFPKGDDLLN